MHKDDPATQAPLAATGAAAPKPKMDAFWMPFTANRQFKKAPRLLSKAKGMISGRPKAARFSTPSPACGA